MKPKKKAPQQTPKSKTKKSTKGGKPPLKKFGVTKWTKTETSYVKEGRKLIKHTKEDIIITSTPIKPSSKDAKANKKSGKENVTKHEIIITQTEVESDSPPATGLGSPPAAGSEEIGLDEEGGWDVI